MRELNERRLAMMTTEERSEFESAYRQAALAARVGEAARDLRESAGLSQGQLARRMGIQQQAVSRIECGEGGMTLASVQRFADALGADVGIALKLAGGTWTVGPGS